MPESVKMMTNILVVKEADKNGRSVKKQKIKPNFPLRSANYVGNIGNIGNSYTRIYDNTLYGQGVKIIPGGWFGYLEMDKMFQRLGFTRRQINLAALSILGRLINPGSELSNHTRSLKDRNNRLYQVRLNVKANNEQWKIYRHLLVKEIMLHTKLIPQ